MSLKTVALKPKAKPSGFTIVELLVVIVVIGILAAITIVSYTGITAKANESSIKAELANASKKLSMYYAQYESYPTTPGLNLTTGCPTAPNNDTDYCIKFNEGTAVAYNSENSNSYGLTFTKNGLTFTVSQSGTIAAGTPAPSVPTLPESDWITVGTQRWARKNLNVGTRVNGNVAQSNNGGTNIVEKYYYDNDEANCTTYGALYQWNEAMNYSTAESAQGICPVGSHIPSDNDWKILEIQLGMTQTAADQTDWRGVDEGAKLKQAGSSGLDIQLAGNVDVLGGGTSYNQSFAAVLWSSSESSTSVWGRYLDASHANVGRAMYDKSIIIGISVRCLGN